MGLNAVAGKDHRVISPDPVRFSDMMLGAYDPEQRARDMLADGILASILFPTLPRFAGTLFLEFEDKELAHACVRAYNDYMIEEWCPAGPPGLFVPTVITTLWDPILAAAEIHRCADNGARALSIPENTVPLGLPSYWHEHWNPVWQACQDRDVAMCLHIGTSGEVPRPSPEAPDMLSFTLLQVGSIMSSVNLMMSPVCRNYPDVKFVFSEGGIGWLPNAIERADRMWLRHKYYSGLDDTLPSEVFRRNMYLCMIEEPVCLKYRYDIGVDRILWECDYPHTDSTWPDSAARHERGVRCRRGPRRRDRCDHPQQRRARLQLEDRRPRPRPRSRRRHLSHRACRRKLVVMGNRIDRLRAERARKETAVTERHDVVVLGTGAAGLTAAVTAHEGGAKVAVLDKADLVGGTTAWSGGQVWIPNNPHMGDVAVADSRERAVTYIMSLSATCSSVGSSRPTSTPGRRWSSATSPDATRRVADLRPPPPTLRRSVRTRRSWRSCCRYPCTAHRPLRPCTRRRRTGR